MFALIDCNNFYVSCERIFNPYLRNKPVVVLSNNDGCVVSRSKEVKDMGVPMGVPVFKIKDLIQEKHIICCSSNYTLYADISKRVMKIISDFFPFIEVYSIDEAFIDLRFTEIKHLELSLLDLKEKIWKYLGVPVAIGAGKTKTLAKVSVTLAKKYPNYNGVYVLTDFSRTKRILAGFELSDIWGIGSKLSKRLKAYGLTSALDLIEADDTFIRKNIHLPGLRTKHELLGKPCIEFEDKFTPKKGICVSRSFAKPIKNRSILEEAIANFIVRACEKLRMQDSIAEELCIYIRTNPFKREEVYYSNSVTYRFITGTNNTSDYLKVLSPLINRIYLENLSYKKAGIYLNSISSSKARQTSLISKNLISKKDNFDSDNLLLKVDCLNKIYGKNTVKFGDQGVFNLNLHPRTIRGDAHYRRETRLETTRRLLSKSFTTNWNDILKVKAF